MSKENGKATAPARSDCPHAAGLTEPNASIETGRPSDLSIRDAFFRRLGSKIEKITASWSDREHKSAISGIDGRSKNCTPRHCVHEESIDI